MIVQQEVYVQKQIIFTLNLFMYKETIQIPNVTIHVGIKRQVYSQIKILCQRKQIFKTIPSEINIF